MRVDTNYTDYLKYIKFFPNEKYDPSILYSRLLFIKTIALGNTQKMVEWLSNAASELLYDYPDIALMPSKNTLTRIINEIPVNTINNLTKIGDTFYYNKLYEYVDMGQPVSVLADAMGILNIDDPNLFNNIAEAAVRATKITLDRNLEYLYDDIDGNIYESIRLVEEDI